jgi:beta-N-acetylhexosaminidase
MGAGAAALACMSNSGDAPDDTPASASATAAPESTPTPTPSPTPGATVSLEEMIGQMLMVGFRGFTLDPQAPIHGEISSGRVGNTVYFDYDLPSSGSDGRNIRSPDQVAALSRSIQSLSGVTQLIAADQEGGLVARLKPRWGFPDTLSAEELGNLKDLDQTRERAASMAATLAAAGINLNLAPVVDVNVNPRNPVIGAVERSFSADPEVVAQQALAFIEGHHERGVLTTMKHFPGHGSSEADSHLGFVDVTATWSDKELIPFQRVIEAGKADAVMTAHIFNSNLDETYPATLSKKTITGVLRERLGFDGVIVTDDMQMGAIRNFYSFEESIEVAIEAGADIIAIANNGETYLPAVGDNAFRTILAAVQAGRISEERIQQSYLRIMRLKARLV